MFILLKRFFFLLLLFTYMAFIWIQSSHFNPEAVGMALSDRISMKLVLLLGMGFELAHLFEFGVLYLLVIMVFLHYGELTKWMEGTAFVVAFFYGVIDELHQMYVPYRSASIFDLIKNTIGIIAAWWFIRKYYISNHNAWFSRTLRRLTQPAKSG
jgi:polysaccharide biosynthesis protein VpsQ